MAYSQTKLQPPPIVRTYEPRDHDAVQRLYTEGLLAGQIAANDTGADIDNIVEAYLEPEMSHFWVAEVHGEVVGMIGVAWEEGHTAEVRRLRVDKSLQHTDVAEQLIEVALAHCKHHPYLKVRLDTRFDTTAAVDLFDRFGFQHVRTRSVQGKDLLEFYLDLYRQPANDKENRE